MRAWRGIVGLIALAALAACGGDITDTLDSAGLGGAEGADQAGSGGGPSTGGRSPAEPPMGSGGQGAAKGTGSGGLGGSSGAMVGGASSGGSSSGTGGEPLACGTAKRVDGVAGLYDRRSAAAATGTDAAFFHFPWPEISRPLGELASFPNPSDASGCLPATSGGLVGLLVDAIASFDYRSYVIGLSSRHLREFARHPGIYVAFDGTLSPDLPTAGETLHAGSPVFLINVDPGSSQRGARTPMRLRVYESSHYLPAHTLAAAIEGGFPLLPSTTYALVVKRELGDGQARPLGSPLTFEQQKEEASCSGVDGSYAATFDYLEVEQAISRSSIAMMTVFRTGDPTAPFIRAGAELTAPSGQNPAQLSLAGPATDLTSDGYHLIQGVLQVPFQQEGAPPYLPKINGTLTGVSVDLDPESVSGDFSPGDLQSRFEPVEFALSLPGGALLDSNSPRLPVVIYGPGTGGGRLSPMDLGIAGALAELGIAVFSTTPVMHGARAHQENIDPALVSQTKQIDALLGTNYHAELIATVESGNLFFNPLNLAAARGNPQQAALDFLWQAKALAKTRLDVEIAGQLRSIEFDPERIYFFGHSQGAGAGPLLAASEEIRAAVLSGASGYVPALVLDKTKPADQIDIAQMIDYIVCDDPEEPLDVTHPFMSLLGHWFEPSDAELYAEEFVFGARPKPTMVLVGRDDAYAPAVSNDAITTALRLNQATPRSGFEPRSVLGQSLLDALFPGAGYGSTSAQVQGNLAGTTGAFKQYHDPSCADDHFVYVCNSGAMQDWLAFFEGALGGTPLVP